MKTMKKVLSLMLVAVMIFSVTGAVSASQADDWDSWWSESGEEIEAAVTMFPGDNESERYIAWYSDSAEGYVELYGKDGTEKFTADSKKTFQGDYRLGAVVTGLEEGTYSYKCFSGDWQSDKYEFDVKIQESFTAVYLTDIHVADDKFEENSVSKTAQKFSGVIETAKDTIEENGGTLDLILSAGDQASSARRAEYVGLSAPESIKEIPFATTVGNHDRKSTGYKDYTFLPNEGELKFKSYVGTDYYFTQGNTLFLMLDSCNCSMRDHYKFIKNAVAENEDAQWIVASIHHDLFGGREPHLNSENTMLRLLWTGIFDEFGVDLVLYGHSHYHTVSNVIYNNKTSQSLVDVNEITDPKGTVYIASNSINNSCDLTDEDGNEPPLGEHVGHSYLTEDSIYNVLDFKGDTLEIKSYTVESDELFDTLTIKKTSKQGGHEYKNTSGILRPLIFFVSRIVNIINNVDPYQTYNEQGYEVSFLEGIIGS